MKKEKKKPSLEDSLLVHLAAYHMGKVNQWKEVKKWEREICLNIYNAIKDYEKETKVDPDMGKKPYNARPRTSRKRRGIQ